MPPVRRHHDVVGEKRRREGATQARPARIGEIENGDSLGRGAERCPEDAAVGVEREVPGRPRDPDTMDDSAAHEIDHRQVSTTRVRHVGKSLARVHGRVPRLAEPPERREDRESRRLQQAHDAAGGVCDDRVPERRALDAARACGSSDALDDPPGRQVDGSDVRLEIRRDESDEAAACLRAERAAGGDGGGEGGCEEGAASHAPDTSLGRPEVPWDLLPAALRSPVRGPLPVSRPYGPAVAGAGRDERAWVRGAQRGSASDLEALFRAHWPRAHRAAYLVVHDAALAEDIAQEAFLAAIRNLDRFDRRRPFGPWLHRIVVNRAIDAARARSLRARSGARRARRPVGDLRTGRSNGARGARGAPTRATSRRGAPPPARVHARRDRRAPRPAARDRQLAAAARARCDEGALVRHELDRIAVPEAAAARSARAASCSPPSRNESRSSRQRHTLRCRGDCGSGRSDPRCRSRDAARTRGARRDPRGGGRRAGAARALLAAGAGQPARCIGRRCLGRPDRTARNGCSGHIARRAGRRSAASSSRRSRNELAALEPDGDVRWTLARPRRSSPRWAGTASGHADRLRRPRRPPRRRRRRHRRPARSHRPGGGLLRGAPARSGSSRTSSRTRFASRRWSRDVWSGRRSEGRASPYSRSSGRPTAVASSSSPHTAFASSMPAVASSRGMTPRTGRGTSTRHSVPAPTTSPWCAGTARRAPSSSCVPGGRSSAAPDGSAASTGRPTDAGCCVGWPTADQWVFVRSDGKRIRAVADVAGQFRSRTFPRVEGWCCTE